MKKVLWIIVFISININALDVKLYQESCKSNATFCNKLGDYYFEKEDLGSASKFYKKGCNLANPQSCLEVANIYRIRKSTDGQEKYLKKSCNELNHGLSCGLLGLMYQDIKKYEKAIFPLKKACYTTDNTISVMQKQESCNQLGTILDTFNRNIRDASEASKKACDLSKQSGYTKVRDESSITMCDSYNFISHNISTNFLNKLQSYCDNYDNVACIYLTDIYAKGRGKIKQNKKKEKQIVEKLCQREESSNTRGSWCDDLDILNRPPPLPKETDISTSYSSSNSQSSEIYKAPPCVKIWVTKCVYIGAKSCYQVEECY